MPCRDYNLPCPRIALSDPIGPINELPQGRDQAFHLRPRVLISGANRGLNTLGKYGFSLLSAIILHKGLRVHLVAGDIVGVGADERSKVRFGGGQIALFDALERDAVAGESVIGIFGEEVFEFLAAAFTLFGHGNVSYYNCGTESVQSDSGENDGTVA